MDVTPIRGLALRAREDALGIDAIAPSDLTVIVNGSSWLRSRTLGSGPAKRARMILLAADGVRNRAITERVGA